MGIVSKFSCAVSFVPTIPSDDSLENRSPRERAVLRDMNTRSLVGSGDHSDGFVLHRIPPLWVKRTCNALLWYRE